MWNPSSPRLIVTGDFSFWEERLFQEHDLVSLEQTESKTGRQKDDRGHKAAGREPRVHSCTHMHTQIGARMCHVAEQPPRDGDGSGSPRAGCCREEAWGPVQGAGNSVSCLGTCRWQEKVTQRGMLYIYIRHSSSLTHKSPFTLTKPPTGLGSFVIKFSTLFQPSEKL